MDELKELLKNCIEERNESGEPSLVRLVLSDRRKKSLPYRRLTLRPVRTGKKVSCFVYQAEYAYENKVTHDNFSADAALAVVLQAVMLDFKQINVQTEREEIQVLAARPDRPRITRRKMQTEEAAAFGKPSSAACGSAAASGKSVGRGAAADCAGTCVCGGSAGSSDPRAASSDRFSHNRTKKRLIPDGVPCDFLIRLGVMDENGKVFQKYYAKYRQINRYLEIVDDALEYLPKQARPLRIIDFGCGKAYLTFALYYYLKILQGRNVEIVGLDLKEDVIAFCTHVAEDLGYAGLRFLRGDIADYQSDFADMVVTLHACDVATDYALINAVSWNAPVILSVPCCQHELFRQIKNPLHEPMYRHGILKDRFTEILTDGLRALKLEEAGYKVSLIEFTSLEHTARNIMIRAVRNGAAKPNPKAREEYEALCAFYGVTPTIGKLQIK